MTITDAKEILKRNVLDLGEAGIDLFPFKTVNIDSFFIKNNNDEMVDLIGLLAKPSERSLSDCDLVCKSFFVQQGHTYWYRESFRGAMKLIEAIRCFYCYSEPE